MEGREEFMSLAWRFLVPVSLGKVSGEAKGRGRGNGIGVARVILLGGTISRHGLTSSLVEGEARWVVRSSSSSRRNSKGRFFLACDSCPCRCRLRLMVAVQAVEAECGLPGVRGPDQSCYTPRSGYLISEQ